MDGVGRGVWVGGGCGDWEDGEQMKQLEPLGFMLGIFVIIVVIISIAMPYLRPWLDSVGG